MTVLCEHCGGRVEQYSPGCPGCGAPQCCQPCCVGRRADHGPEINGVPLSTLRNAIGSGFTPSSATVVDALHMLEECWEEAQELRAELAAERERAEKLQADADARLGDPRDIPADTGHREADRLICRLVSDDPDFDDCTDAVVLIRRLIADSKAPDKFATWKDAAVDERMKRVAAETERDALRAELADANKTLDANAALIKEQLDELAALRAEKVSQCGHPSSLMLRSAETGKALYCELCDERKRRRDAESMEEHYKARAEKAEANYRFMVERAADEKLDGYRELGSKCAALEERAEKAEAERDALKTDTNDIRAIVNELRCEAHEITGDANSVKIPRFTFGRLCVAAGAMKIPRAALGER